MPWFKLAVFGVQTVMKHAVEHYFGGGSELLNMHERLADLLLIALSASFEDGGNLCSSHSFTPALAPTVFSMTAVMLCGACRSATAWQVCIVFCMQT